MHVPIRIFVDVWHCVSPRDITCSVVYNLIKREVLWLFFSIRRIGYGVNYLLLLNTFIPLTFLLPIKLCFFSLFLFYRAWCSPWVLLICRLFVFIPQRPFIDTVGLAQRFRHTSCPFIFLPIFESLAYLHRFDPTARVVDSPFFS